ncbi:MAG: FIG004453: protein YceG like, partial [uncultured Solirubrobacteraceae bacterium]
PKVKVVETYDLTIPEGRSLREVAKLVADSPVRGRYARAAGEKRFLRRARALGLPAGRDTLEGFLFPATYELTGDAGVRDLIGKQLDAFEQNFASVPMRRAKRRNLTRYDVLIIASMIEREAMISKERPLIAAVIHNRLRAGMPLGIDATIRYATDNWTRPIRVSELEADGPYNTRLRQGLPPTPIGNPGLDSLKAAANPADADYLFYVVKPGTCGEHAFSATDAEFQRDSARYNAERDAAGGKSPTTC